MHRGDVDSQRRVNVPFIRRDISAFQGNGLHNEVLGRGGMSASFSEDVSLLLGAQRSQNPV